MEGICKLCQKQKKLIKSHIIPRSILRILSLGEKFDGQIIAIHQNKKTPVRRPGGAYEYMLCSKCDGSLGAYDQYIQKFVSNVKLQRDKSNLGWITEGFDNNYIKLFCMSYLWRASITSKKEFSDVSLGEKHENMLRKLIYDKNPGSVNDYSVFIGKFVSSSKHGLFSKIIMVPARTRIGNINFYEIYLPNLYKIFIKVDQQPLTGQILEFALKSRNFVPIYDFGEYENSKEHRMLRLAARRGQRIKKSGSEGS
ncbi:MAG TPA: hypothetical protein VLF39_00035 [Candidatus Saccharimonadales bacterium]|nr:hypothetical protein [Candidatus Saccharimonadales bacterium]